MAADDTPNPFARMLERRAERTTSAAKDVTGLHYEENALDRTFALKPEFNARPRAADFVYFRTVETPVDTGRQDNHADIFKGIDVGAPPNGLLRKIFREPEHREQRTSEDRDQQGSSMVRASAPAPALKPQPYMRAATDYSLYYRQLAQERAAETKKIIAARETRQLERERNRDRGR